jgi:flagellar hook assembly protein FlgD
LHHTSTGSVAQKYKSKKIKTNHFDKLSNHKVSEFIEDKPNKKMKNLIATAAIAIFTLTAASAKEPVARKIDANNIHTATKSFGAAMYQVKETETVKLMVETNSRLTVKISDEAGNVLSRETIKKSSAIKINLEETPSGIYFVEISNGFETISRQISKTKNEITL